MIYDLIAPMYDRHNAEIDYKTWADFYERIILREMKEKPELVVDLGCGTGSMTVELAKRGYDMIGIDHSTEMLNVAMDRAYDEELSVLYLCQELSSFELYGTVGVAVCCLDTVNHLCDEGELSDFFRLVHNYLDPDGLFLFDINGKGRFEGQYAEKTYTDEDEDRFLIWQNEYDEKSGICDFFITLFEKMPNGSYHRQDECERERFYSIEYMKTLSESVGFEWIGAYSDFEFTSASDADERIYIAIRCKK